VMRECPGVKPCRREGMERGGGTGR
jgi:hypothetical protein